MTKFIKVSTIIAIAIYAIVGCGSNSTPSSSTGPSVETGTGYYVDNAVKGVKYECGTKKGTTDAQGKFTFEKGKECKFSLAGIPLRTTPANKLEDGKKILEDNPKVAKFLQSIDSDGDLNNGIQITDEVLTALTTALETSQSTGKLPEGEVLTNVVADVGNNVEGVSGEVRTDAEVDEHLAQTQTEITKKLFADKTFYLAYNDHGTDTIEKLTFNNNVTSMEWEVILGNKDSGTNSVNINGNKMIVGNDIIPKIILNTTDKYIIVDNQDGDDDSYLYYNEADAKAALESENTGSNNDISSKTLSELIVGKTYYLTNEESTYTDENGNIISKGHVDTYNFNTDGDTLNITWTENGATKSHTLSYSVSNDTLTISGTYHDGSTVNVTLNAPVTKTSKYIAFSANYGKFYKTQAIAEAALFKD